MCGALMMLTGKWIRPGVYTVEELSLIHIYYRTGFAYVLWTTCTIIIAQNRRGSLVYGMKRCFYQLTYTGYNGHNRNINIATGDRQYIVAADRYQAVCQLHDKAGRTKTYDIFGITGTL